MSLKQGTPEEIMLLVPVGTSALEVKEKELIGQLINSLNQGKEVSNYANELAEFRYFQEIISNDSYISDLLAGNHSSQQQNSPGNNLKREFEKKLEAHIKDAISNQDIEKGRKFYNQLTAEIASIIALMFYRNKGSEEALCQVRKILLFSSETGEGAYCTWLNKWLLQFIKTRDNNGIPGITNNTDVMIVNDRPVPNLNLKSVSLFKKGVRELLSIILSEIKGFKTQQLSGKVYLDVTGGFKGAVPYSSVAAFLEGHIEIFYLFEGKPEVIFLPSLPLSLDYSELVNYRSHLLQLKTPSKEILINFPKAIFDLYHEADGGFELSPLGHVIMGKFKEEGGKVSGFGKGYLLTDLIKDEGLKSSIRSCIDDWEYIWLGDLIPETVEHGRGHCHRLLEFAAQIIYPLRAQRGNILNDHELAALIAAIWLHDIGHAGLTLEDNKKGKPFPVGEFKTLVRELHNILSAQRIIGEAEHLGFKQGNKKGIIFKKEDAKTIAEICRYHRFWMPLKELHVKKCLEFTNGSLCGGICLECNLEVNGQKIKDIRDGEEGKQRAYEMGCAAFFEPATSSLWKDPIYKDKDGKANFAGGEIDARFLAALLRLLDACDVQHERVISENYREVREERTKEEVEFIKRQLDDAFEAVKVSGELSNINPNRGELQTLHRVVLEGSSALNILEKKIASLIKWWWESKDVTNDEADKLFLSSLKTWLTLANAKIFKERQKREFDKHSSIKSVYLRYDENKQEFVVNLFVEDYNEVKEKVESIAKDIWQEYQKAKDILSKRQTGLSNIVAIDASNNSYDLLNPKNENAGEVKSES